MFKALISGLAIMMLSLVVLAGCEKSDAVMVSLSPVTAAATPSPSLTATTPIPTAATPSPSLTTKTTIPISKAATPSPSLTTTTPIPKAATKITSTYLNAVQTYGNFETAGVDIKFKTLITAETGKMFYKKSTDSTYQEGQPFTKYDGNHMATSLFDLSANTTYDVKVEVSGSQGKTTDLTTVTTKPKYTLPTPVRTVNVADQTQLDAAIFASLPGDHILLDPKGTYKGFLISAHSGTAEHPILIGSQTSEKPVFSGGASINQSDFVVITNLEIHALSLNGSSYSVILNNYIHDGTSAKNNYDAEVNISQSNSSNFPGVGGHLIMNNVIGDDDHDPLDESKGILNSFQNTNGRTYSGVKGQHNPGAFNTIRGNTIYGLVDGISTTGDEGSKPMGPNDPDLLLAHPNQNMDVYDNVIYDMQDDGIETDGIVVNARFFRNQIGRSKNAISLAPVYPGPVYVLRNTSGGSLEANVKMNTNIVGLVRNIYIYNNTFVQKTAEEGSYGVIYQGEPALTQDIVFKNNIFSALTRVVNGDMYTKDNYHKNHVFDYNLGYSKLTKGTIYKWSTAMTDPLNNSFYTSLADFTASTGQEVHGVWGDPLLNLSPKADYPNLSWLIDLHIKSESSPAVNAGAVIPGITNGFHGSAPDIGAYEYK